MALIVANLFFFGRITGFFVGTDVKKLKQKHNVEGLISALKSKDPTVQYEAAEALGDLRMPVQLSP